jgi:hypothetical protein
MTQQDGDDLGIWSEFGTAAGIAADRAARALSGNGEAGGAPGDEARSGLGDRPDLDGLPAVSRLGDAPSLGAWLGEAASEAAAGAARDVPPPKGYHNRVDADGDGTLDRATYRGDGHGGAEILVDLDGDGRADFVGHDTDLDNKVDYADYDKNHDGIFEKRMYDDDNDGLLDRTEWHGES